MSIPPRKRKTAASSLRQIARRLKVRYRHTKPTDDDGTRAEEALVEFREKGGTSLGDLREDLTPSSGAEARQP